MADKILHTKKNKKALIAALEKTLGVVTQACKLAGVSRETYYNYYNSDADFKKAADDTAEIALDFAESKLHKNIEAGKEASTIFYLKTKGKSRGYVERVEHEDVGVSQKLINWVLPSNGQQKSNGKPVKHENPNWRKGKQAV